MTETDGNRTDDENELLCETLLRWKRIAPRAEKSEALPLGAHAVWFNGRVNFETPSFSAWSTAGWIADRFRDLHIDFALFLDVSGGWSIDIPRAHEYTRLGAEYETGPGALRAAGIAVAKLMKAGEW